DHVTLSEGPADGTWTAQRDRLHGDRAFVVTASCARKPRRDRRAILRSLCGSTSPAQALPPARKIVQYVTTCQGYSHKACAERQGRRRLPDGEPGPQRPRVRENLRHVLHVLQ